MRSFWVRNNALAMTEEGKKNAFKLIRFCPVLLKKRPYAMLLIENGNKSVKPKNIWGYLNI